MAHRSSEMDKLIDVSEISDADDGSGSELDNNILSYSGSDDYKTSSNDSSDNKVYFCPGKKRRSQLSHKN